MQILEAKGIETEKISTDLSEDPWRNLRDLIYEGRIEIPRLRSRTMTDQGRAVPAARRAARPVQAAQRAHRPPADGSKDEADALACAAMTAVQLGGREEGAGERRYYEPASFDTGGHAECRSAPSQPETRDLGDRPCSGCPDEHCPRRISTPRGGPSPRVCEHGRTMMPSRRSPE
jgi:hypothetical protein